MPGTMEVRSKRVLSVSDVAPLKRLSLKHDWQEKLACALDSPSGLGSHLYHVLRTAAFIVSPFTITGVTGTVFALDQWFLWPLHLISLVTSG